MIHQTMGEIPTLVILHSHWICIHIRLLTGLPCCPFLWPQRTLVSPRFLLGPCLVLPLMIFSLQRKLRSIQMLFLHSLLFSLMIPSHMLWLTNQSWKRSALLLHKWTKSFVSLRLFLMTHFLDCCPYPCIHQTSFLGNVSPRNTLML